MSNILPNLPIENLTRDNDYIGVIDKAELIKNFLKSNSSEFKEIKMFTIYGEWGSGKSTLMKYLEKELKPSFNTFFFESWEHESDNNLSLSLLEFLIKNSDDVTEQTLKELLKIGGQLFKGFAKSVRISLPGLSIDGKTLIETIEEDDETFLESKSNFKTEFIRWEDNVTKGKKPKCNAVFIDDLDRCEPENVLNLLSALKLFFTYGKKTIFLCGIDKKAVEEAVKTKYGEVVKSNEYLEKVFDISFTMPEHPDISKLVKIYFEGIQIKYAATDLDLGDFISQFFVEINFTNPRRIKKVLNKYLLIKNLIDNRSNTRFIFPNIISNETGSLFETILTLFLLIIREFEPDNYKQLFNISVRKGSYGNILKSLSSDADYSRTKGSIDSFLTEEYIDWTLERIKALVSRNQGGESVFSRFVANFAPVRVDSINSNPFTNGEQFEKVFGLKRKNYEYYFTLYLYRNISVFKNSNFSKELSLKDYKLIIANLI